MQAENATFAFLPDAPEWPALTQVSGELVIDRASLAIRQARARSGGVDWTAVNGAIRELGERPVLTLDATARGPLADMLAIVNGTPVGGWIGQSLAKAGATGPAELQLGLGIPLTNASATSVRGSLALPGNDVRIGADTPLLARGQGPGRFHRRRASASSARRRACSAATLPSKAGRRRTTASASAARAWRPVRACVAPRSWASWRVSPAALNGQAAYRINLGFARGRPQLQVTSDLVGMAADLPAPLGKAAASPLELRYQIGPADEGSGSGARERLRVELAGVLQASYLLEHAGGGTRVVNGGIGVNRAVADALERRRRQSVAAAARR